MDTANLHFNNTIKNWDEAVPLGNGQLGCLIWDSSDKLRFTLDRSDLWDCSNPPENQKNFSYADIINSVKRRKKEIYINNTMPAISDRRLQNFRQER